MISSGSEVECFLLSSPAPGQGKAGLALSIYAAVQTEIPPCSVAPRRRAYGPLYWQHARLHAAFGSPVEFLLTLGSSPLNCYLKPLGSENMQSADLRENLAFS